MNKAQLVNEVAKKTQLSKAKALQAVNTAFEAF